MDEMQQSSGLESLSVFTWSHSVTPIYFVPRLDLALITTELHRLAPNILGFIIISVRQSTQIRP